MSENIPHDESAERAVIGSILQSPAALRDVIGTLTPRDFYNPRHEEIFTVALELFSNGENVEPVAVLGILSRDGRASKVGGGTYLYELIESVPTVANVTFWAKQVADTARLRRVSEFGMRVEQMAKSGTVVPEDLMSLAYAELDRINGVESGRASAVNANDSFTSTLELLEDFEKNKGNHGVSTGFPDLDHMLSGLRGGQMVTVAARPGMGKALALDTPIPTPNGWSTMGELEVGDSVYGPDGRPTRIAAATDVMKDRPCYRLTFSDGSTVIADAEHLWYTESHTERKARRYRDKRNSQPGTWLPFEVLARMETDIAKNSVNDSWISAPEFAREYGLNVDSPKFRGILAEVSAMRIANVPSIVPMLTYDPAQAGQVLQLASVKTTSGMTTLGDLASATKLSRKTVKNTLRRHGVTPVKMSLPSDAQTRAVKQYRRSELLHAMVKAGSARIAGRASTIPTGSVRTTREIAETLKASGRSNHAIPIAAPLVGAESDLPLPPYTFGAWLGDGTSAGNSLTTTDPQILSNIRDEGVHVTDLSDPIMYGLHIDEVLPAMGEYVCDACGEDFKPNARGQRFCSLECGYKWREIPASNTAPNSCSRCGEPVKTPRETIHAGCRIAFKTVLRSMNVLDNKHIPAEYLRASERQRRELLAGLLDTDGSVAQSGASMYHTTSARLAEDVRDLIAGLGYRCTVSTKRVAGRTEESSTCYSLYFTTSDRAFHLDRKADAVSERRTTTSREFTAYRYIVSAEGIDSVPVRCIQVEREDGLFLATRSMIITHNSTLSLDICRHATIFENKTALFFTLEMSHEELMMRFLSAHAQVELGHMRSGEMTEAEWQRIFARGEQVRSAKLFVDDSPGITPGEIKAKARRVQASHGLDLIVIDYLQLMSSGRRVESRQQEVSEFSRSIKLMAKELHVPIIAVSQLNRGSESRTDKRPQLSDLRESGAIEQDSDVVLLIYREDQVNPETERMGEADIIIAKQRSGPTGSVPLAWQGQYSRFASIARDF